MQVELSREDLAVITMLLDKEESETRVEIHHSRDPDFKDLLRNRELQVRDLLARLREATAKAPCAT